MFDKIAPRYDFLNHLLSLGIDRRWRKHTVKSLGDANPSFILDVATGTGDLAIALHRHFPGARVTGIDLSDPMIRLAHKKILRKGLEKFIEVLVGDGEELPFDNNSFDIVSVAFGVRNFEHLDQGLKEMYRVLKPGGQIRILEFSTPRQGIFQRIFTFYFRHILPRVGKWISGDARAYTYLPESVAAFPERDSLTARMGQAGFKNCQWKELTYGTCCLYLAEK